MKRLLLLATALLTLSSPTLAETVYVGDTIYVPLRTGPGNEYRILHRGVKTGTELTLLDQKKINNFYKVKINSSDQEGYMPSQYIFFEPPASMQLEKLKAENTQLTAKINAVNGQLAALQNDLKERDQTLNNDSQNAQELAEDLSEIKAVSSKSVELDQKNTILRTTNEELLARVQTLEIDNQQLADNAKQQWYLYGVGTVLLGLIIGLIAPSLRSRKKTATWI